jgi:peptidyl-prolyl cis-trans isomerase D
MLQRIRENIKGVGAWVIVRFLCVPFAFWGINQYFDPVARDAAASVNGEEISSFQLEQAFQQRYQQLIQAFGDQLPPEMIDERALRREELNQLIVQELLRQKMQDLRFRAGDDQVREMIRSIPVFQEDGRFSPERYRQALSMSGRSAAGFEALIRQDIALQQLQQGISGSEFITPVEAALAMAIEEQGRRHSAVTVSDEPFRQQVELSDDEVHEYYVQNQDRYLTEEIVDLEYVELSLNDFAGAVEVTEDMLRDMHSQRAGQYASQEQRRARHILIEGQGDNARARAEDALRRVQAGEDFAAVAREMSDDPVSAEEGGDLGMIERDQLVGEFEDALFAMNEGEVRGPVRSDFGFHVIRLDEIRAPELPEFEEIREQLAQEYREQRARQTFDSAVQRLADAVFRDEGSLGTAAAELDLEIREIDGVTRTAGEGIAANRQVRQTAFTEMVLQEGRNSDPVHLDDGRVVALRIADYRPAEPRPFEEVEGGVREQLVAERARQLAREKAESVLERARAGESLADIAQAEGVVFRDEGVTYRQTPDIGPAYAEALFAAEYPLEAPVFGMAATENDDFVVFRLTEVIPARYAELSRSERESRRRNLRQREASLVTAAYIAEMRDNADIVVRERQLEQQ